MSLFAWVVCASALLGAPWAHGRCSEFLGSQGLLKIYIVFVYEQIKEVQMAVGAPELLTCLQGSLWTGMGATRLPSLETLLSHPP